jgi:beta-glucosidase
MHFYSMTTYMTKLKLAEIEGLWKLLVILPRYGVMKIVLEFEIDNGTVEGDASMNDREESDLNSIEWNQENQKLTASAIFFNRPFIFQLKFIESKCEGFIIDGTMKNPIKGYRMKFGEDQPGLNKEAYAVYEKELQNLVEKSFEKLDDSEIHKKVAILLEKMTLEEKIGQMYQLPHVGNITGPDMDLENTDILVQKGKVGSFLGVHTPLSCYALQKIAVEKSRLGIPLIFMADVIHGFRTIFPVPLAQSCSWDMDVIEKSQSVAAKECAAAGINLTFAPMVDIARDPRWGRIVEGSGEDPFLGYHCAAAHVNGFQGKMASKLGDIDAVIACVKHFAAYGGAEAGRDYNTVDMSEYRLRNYYLPPYKGGVDADAGCIMSSFNCILGQPATGNPYVLRDILRKEWNFEGMTISDYNSVIEMIAHGTAGTMKEAAKKAVESTLDIEMVSTAYISSLKTLVESGEIDESLINDATSRILFYKYKIGLFFDPYRFMNPKLCNELFLSPEHRKIARETAQRSIVLLENKKIPDWNTEILPLTVEKIKKMNKIAIIGPFSDEPRINGAWSALGNIKESISLKQGIVYKVKEKNIEIDLIFLKGCGVKQKELKNLDEILNSVKDADILILAMGEEQNMSGEAKSRGYLNIPGVQEELAKELKKLNKPIMLILFNGRPLVIPWFKENMDAILEVWMPGTEGGNAIADVLFGDYNPSGKITATFPYALGQVPIFYNSYSTGRPPLESSRDAGFLSTYIDMPNYPLYEFGYGLSYTNFNYSEISLSSHSISQGGKIEASILVKNSGDFAGEEIIQLYLQDIVGNYVRPVKMLKGFSKILLEPNEERKVTFKITEEELKYWFPGEVKPFSFEFKAEYGDFIIYIGSSSNTQNQAVFSYQKQ